MKSVPYLLVFLLFLLAGCGQDVDPGDVEVNWIELRGTYVDDAGSTHKIEQDGPFPPYDTGTWTVTAVDEQVWVYGFLGSSADNTIGYVVTGNRRTNPTNGGLISRFDWESSGGQLYLCHTTETALTFPDAVATSADHGDLAGVGCNGGPWLILSRP